MIPFFWTRSINARQNERASAFNYILSRQVQATAAGWCRTPDKNIKDIITNLAIQLQ